MTTLTNTRKFTVDEYYKLQESGILTEDDRVELIQGDIVDMSPIGKRHAACVKRLLHLFSEQQKREEFIIGIQDPVYLDAHNETYPDISILQWTPDFYESEHPGPEDVLLLIEVAESSLIYDKEKKVPLYAEHNIPEVWVVDLTRDAIETYRSPEDRTYENKQIVRAGDAVHPEQLSGVSCKVEHLF